METTLKNVASLFTFEINKLEARKPGTHLSIQLSVRKRGYSDEAKPVVSLTASFYADDHHHDVKASNLGALMDEVYRRLQFTDREAIKIDALEASLTALPPPDDRHNLDGTTLDDDIPF